MTTTVVFQYPKPNHLCARITRQTPDQYGGWNSWPQPILLGPENQIVVEYVHSGQRLIIEEMAANEEKPLPRGELGHLRSLAAALEKVAPVEFGALRTKLLDMKASQDDALNKLLDALKLNAIEPETIK